MVLHLKIAGILLIMLAFIHLAFPKYFNWKKELQSLTVINRQLMYVHTFFIALTVFLMGLLCLTASSELIKTSLGQRISLGLAIFWTIRLVIQFVGYSSKTWSGKPLETFIHILFSLFWAYLSTLFFLIYFE